MSKIHHSTTTDHNQKSSSKKIHGAGPLWTKFIDECKKKQFDDSECWSVERKKHFVNAPRWSIEKNGYQFWQKGGTTEEKVSVVLESELSSEVPVPSSNSRTFRKLLSILHCKTNVLLPEGFHRVFYHVGNGKELRSIVKQWF